MDQSAVFGASAVDESADNSLVSEPAIRPVGTSQVRPDMDLSVQNKDDNNMLESQHLNDEEALEEILRSYEPDEELAGEEVFEGVKKDKDQIPVSNDFVDIP